MDFIDPAELWPDPTPGMNNYSPMSRHGEERAILSPVFTGGGMSQRAHFPATCETGGTATERLMPNLIDSLDFMLLANAGKASNSKLRRCMRRNLVFIMER